MQIGILEATLSEVGGITGTLSATGGIECGITIPEVISPDPYEGTVEITPSETEQVLNTAGRMLNENIVISPIPSNYGLITWDGTTLTVS